MRQRALGGLYMQVVIYDYMFLLRSSCSINLTVFNDMLTVYKCKHKWKGRKS